MSLSSTTLLVFPPFSLHHIGPFMLWLIPVTVFFHVSLLRFNTLLAWHQYLPSSLSFTLVCAKLCFLPVWLYWEERLVVLPQQTGSGGRVASLCVRWGWRLYSRHSRCDSETTVQWLTGSDFFVWIKRNTVTVVTEQVSCVLDICYCTLMAAWRSTVTIWQELSSG